MASAATLMMPTVDAAPTLALLENEFFLAMESGRIHWGDLFRDDADVSPAPAVAVEERDERIVEWWTDEYKTAERLEGWEVPDLTLRSGIEEHFPVVLLPLPASEDGRERFIVKFDDRVDEWAATRAESNDENAEYAEWVQTRLIFALRQYSHKYRLESDGSAEDTDHVAIFAMAHPSAAARRARAVIPTLTSFPVSWEQDRADHTRHLVKIHHKRMSESDYDLETLGDDLAEALSKCEDCTFARAESGSPYLMIVTIPTAPAPKRYACTCVHCGGAAAAAPPAPAPRPAPVPAAPHPAPAPAAAAPRPAAAAPRPAVGGAGAGPRALDVMRANKLAWDRDGRTHYIKHRSREQETRILAELARCCDCTVEPTPRDPTYMCVLTLH